MYRILSEPTNAISYRFLVSQFGSLTQSNGGRYHKPIMIEDSLVEKLVGKILSGRFKVRAPLPWKGLFFEAQDRKLDRQLILRILPPDNKEAVRTRLRSAFMLNHPSILKPLDIDQDGDIEFIIYEYAEGEPIRLILEKGGEFDPAMIIKVGVNIADGLIHGHSNGLLHGALTSDTVIVAGDLSVKLVDYGIGDLLYPDRLKAPEEKNGRLDERTEIWHIGAVLYEMATGSQPLAILKGLDDLPNVLSDAIRKCLDPNPANRYQTVEEFKDDIISSLKQEKERQSASTAPHHEVVPPDITDPVIAGHLRAAAIFEEMGEIEDAKNEYKAVLEKDPSNKYAIEAIKRIEVRERLEKAQLLEEDGNFQEAKELYKEVLRIDPTNEAAVEGLRRVTRMQKKEFVVSQDGHGDFDNISDAVRRADSGYTIWVKGGVYVEQVNLKSGVKIIGDGKVFVKNYDGPVFVGRGVSSVSLKNLKIAGGLMEATTEVGAIDLENCSDINIEQNSFLNCAIGVRAVKSEVVIEDNTFHDSSGIGIIALGNSELRISNNSIWAHEGVAISITGSKAYLENNRIFENQQGALGIYTNSEVTSSYNEFYEHPPTVPAVVVQESKLSASNDRIRDNHGGAYRIKSNSTVTLTEVEIWGCHDDAIVVEESHLTIDGSKVYNNENNGILVHTNSELELKNSEIWSHSSNKADEIAAIQVIDSKLTMEGNKIYDNVASGVMLKHNTQAVLKNNDFWGHEAPPIWIHESKAYLEANKIHDNKGTGVMVYKGSELAMKGNEVWRHLEKHPAIAIQEARAMLEANKIHDNKGSGIEIMPASDVVMRGNEIWRHLEETPAIEIKGAKLTVEIGKIYDNHGIGIFVHSTSDVTIKGVDFYNYIKNPPIKAVHSRVSVEKCKFHENNSSAISLENCDFRVRGCDLKGHPRKYPALVVRGGSGRIDLNKISGNKDISVYVMEGAEVEVRSNEVWDNDYPSIVIEGARASIESNRLHNNRDVGIWIHKSSKVKVKNNDMWKHPDKFSAIMIQESEVNMEGNKIHDNEGDGISIHQKSDVVIKGNDFWGHRENRHVIWINRAKAWIEGNVFRNNAACCIYVIKSEVRVVKNTFARNSAPYLIYLEGAKITDKFFGTSVKVKDNNFKENKGKKRNF